MLSAAQPNFNQDIYHILRAASHEMLLNSRNSPYSQVLAQKTALEAELNATK